MATRTTSWRLVLFLLPMGLQVITTLISYRYHKTITNNIKSESAIFERQFYFKPLHLFGNRMSMITTRIIICLLILFNNELTLLLLPAAIHNYSYYYYFFIFLPTLIIYVSSVLKRGFAITWGMLMSLYFSLSYVFHFYLFQKRFNNNNGNNGNNDVNKNSEFYSKMYKVEPIGNSGNVFYSPTILSFDIISLFIIEIISSIIIYYFQERSYRKTFLNLLHHEQKRQQCNEELSKSREMLDNIFPERVAKILLVNPQLIMYEEFKNVSILHLDLVGFTPLCSTLQPIDIIKILNRLFTDLDTICSEEYGIEKITTVGDAYICCSGLSNEKNSNLQQTLSDLFFQNIDTSSKYAVSICTAAIRIQHYIATEFNAQPWLVDTIRRPLKARIGIHTGKISGAIIGSPKFMRYYLVGKASVIAEKVQEVCPVGGINISETTRELIRWSNRIKYIPREDNCEVEGYKCYLLDWNK
jgi:class 3 adenylate cyclase